MKKLESGFDETEEGLEGKEREHDQDQVPDPELRQEHEQEDEEKISEDEINEISGEEITITPPVKYRIKINEDSRIEPVIDTPEEKAEQLRSFENDDEEVNESDEIVIGGLSGKASDEIVIDGLSGEASEENEKTTN